MGAFLIARIGPPRPRPSAPRPVARRECSAGRWLGCLALVLVLAAPLGAQDNVPPVSQPPPGGAAESSSGLAIKKIGATNVIEIFKAGGWVMYPILACSILMIALVIERSLKLRRGRVMPAVFVERFMTRLREGKLDRTKALELCRVNGSPVAHILAQAVRRWGRPAADIEAAILGGGEAEVSSLRRNVRLLNGIATVSPLLGLLGTIFGMIAAFDAVAKSSGATSKADQLASGISVALYATAFGLAIAILSLTAYYYFINRVDRLVHDMDLTLRDAVEYLAADIEQPRPERRPRTGGPHDIIRKSQTKE